MASSSNSDLNGGEQKQTVYGLGGIGRSKIINSNSNIKNKFKINNYYGDRGRKDLDMCKDTRGNILPTSKFFGYTTARRNMEEIWDMIIGDVKKKIGVYGMGGIGKTTVMKHIYNRILEGKNKKFNCVIWVTVSKESSVFKLQHDISRKLGLDLSADEDPITRAGALFEKLTKIERYLLILDDLWKGYSLEDVGIPDPDHTTSSNICKLVLTTRSLDVCRSFKCEPIKMNFLSENEAWSLFLHHVGDDVLEVKGLKPIAMVVVSECARLPLALVTIGRSMAGKTEVFEWRDALAKLKAFSKEPGDEGRKVIEQLKFSFDRLENKKFQKCLKYCALYPEDYEIERDELVELLTLEGIIEEKESRRDEIDECNAILNKLINQCLLEYGETYRGVSHVKMHDLVRDMTLQIDDLHSKYSAISGTEMKKLSHVKWSGNLLKVHISNCDFLNASPMCPRLTTFILHNSSLQDIPDSFFNHFEALKVLKLSSCDYLEVLPDSISNLVNLVGLFLRECKGLRYVPTFAKLKRLQSLEIFVVCPTHIPKGLEELSNLRYFNISLYEREVRELVTTSSSSSFALHRLQTPEALIGGKKASCNVFPCLQELNIYGCHRIKVLFYVGLLSTLKNLEKLRVECCWELEEIIGESLDNDKDVNEAMTCVTLPKLRCLELCHLQNLKSICPPTRRLICKSLKEIYIIFCLKLEQCVYTALELEDSGEPSPSPSLQPIQLKVDRERKDKKKLERLNAIYPNFGSPHKQNK